jgi:hypothetical protein
VRAIVGCREHNRGGPKVSEEKGSGLRELMFGPDHSETEDKVLSYVSHRLKEGAHLRDMLEEEYVVRNTTPSERREILTDPRLAQQYREGLEQDYESDELKPEAPPQH